MRTQELLENTWIFTLICALVRTIKGNSYLEHSGQVAVFKNTWSWVSSRSSQNPTLWEIVLLNRGELCTWFLHLFLACSCLPGNKLPNFEFCISYQLTNGYVNTTTSRCLLTFPDDLLLFTKFVIVATELPILIPLTWNLFWITNHFLNPGVPLSFFT